jgi:hypothetical protein
MKHIKTYEWFGNKPKEGDELVQKVIDIYEIY